MHVEEKFKEILSITKDVNHRITERRLASNDIIEYKK
jgi:hypothetical protein